MSVSSFQEFLRNTSMPLLMGIVNVTPDSFSDGGKFLNLDKAYAYAVQLMDEGADIIDIGGESTRPGATPITAYEETKRILPLIQTLKHKAMQRNALLSLDTRNAATMKAGLAEGIHIINDVSALTHDPASLEIAAASHAHIVLMHMQGTPETMQKNPKYKDVVKEVYAYLEQRIDACVQAGISKERLIADPGIGFGKTAEQSVRLLKEAGTFRQLGVPVMIGASRKSFLETLAPGKDRLAASLLAATIAAEQGAHILRVHDVAATKEALKQWEVA
jgi:dihydropteroate synthase